MKTNANAPPGAAKHEKADLWQRIASYSIDQPDSSFPFSRKLAKENNWDIFFTQRAIEEYKKFIWLCCISPHGASPSAVVDEVWHLHLQYTRDYWEEFCAKVLERKVHHEPSGGGTEEKRRHNNWQKETLHLYRQTFRQEPPPDIWLDLPAKFPQKRSRLLRPLSLVPLVFLFLTLSSCADAGAGISIFFLLLFIAKMIGTASGAENTGSPKKEKKETENGSSGGCSSGGSSSGCSSGCGSGCGGGCGGCGS